MDKLKASSSFPTFNSFPSELSAKSMPSFSSFKPAESKLNIEQEDSLEEGEVVKVHKKKKKRKIAHKDEQKDVFMDLDCYLDVTGNMDHLKYQAIRGSAIPIYKRNDRNILGCSNYRIHSIKQDRLILSHISAFADSSRMSYKDFSKQPLLMFNKSKFNTRAFSDFIELPDASEENYIETQSFDKDLDFIAKCAEADRIIHENVYDAESWINLIKLQDKLMDNSKSNKQALMKLVCEKKMTILEKAIQSIPDSEILWVYYMDCYQELAESRLVLNKWDGILMKFPTSFILWKSYISYRSTNPTSFQLDDTVELYDECLENLSKLPPGESKEELLLYLLSRVCALLKQSGYTERGIAYYQALIELNLYCPDHLKGSRFNDRLVAFEDFWDKEYPRFGYPGALGWAKSIAVNIDEVVIEQVVPMNFEEFDKVEDDQYRWYLRENFCSNNQWLPIVGSENDHVVDPFQVVLFEDIQNVLFEVKSKSRKQQLIHDFLVHLGWPILQKTSSKNHLYTDEFLHDQFVNPKLSQFVQVPTNDLEMFFPVNFYPQPTHYLFGDLSFPGNLGTNELEVIKQSGNNRLEFIKRVLEQGAAYYPSSELKIYNLWLESLVNPKKVEKLAKKMLKSEPMNLELWNCYAQILYKLKGAESARQIYSTTLEMFQSFPEQYQQGVEIIYSMYAGLEWIEGNVEKAISILVSSSERSKVKPSVLKPEIQKALKIFHSKFQNMLDFDYSVYSLKMQASLSCFRNALMLEYLEHDVSRCMSLYDKLLSDVIPRGTLYEELFQQDFAIMLSSIAMHTKSFKPGDIRYALETGLQNFPNNTLLLGLYGWNEGRTRIDNRVRGFINNHMKQNPSHILHLFSIWTELTQKSTCSNQIIENVIKDVLETKRSSISFWILAISFTMKTDMQKAKAIYLHAINACPWSKDLYALAFGPLKSVFSRQELDDVFAILDEKEIRIHQLE